MRPKTPFRVGRALRLDKNLLRGSVRIVSNFRMLHKGVNSENVFQNKHSHPPTASQPSSARRAQKVRRVRFQAGSSTPLHLIGVELEKEGDDFGFVRVVRKAAGGNVRGKTGLTCFATSRLPSTR